MNFLTLKNLKLVSTFISIASSVAKFCAIKPVPADEPKQEELFTESEAPVDEPKVTSAPAKRAFNGRKAGCTRDMSVLTRQHFDTIMDAHHLRIAHNQSVAKSGRGERITVSQITQELNKQLGLNKSRQTYSNVWLGNTKRASLPEGNLTLGV